MGSENENKGDRREEGKKVRRKVRTDVLWPLTENRKLKLLLRTL